MPAQPQIIAVALVSLTLACTGGVARAADGPGKPAVDFDRDVRPILGDNCFACHGPDADHRKAGLRLDTREGALAALAAKPGAPVRHAVVPGDPDASAVLARITHADPDERMPKGKPALEAAQVDVIRKWIEAGAPWSEHWAFVAPRRPELPGVKRADWARNPIDRFILARLEAEGLAPTPEADKRTLIRRVTLDLTGLPPTPAEVAAYIADESPDAYERLVDRLLASPAYGERMAWPWLDAARYADTAGYQGDPTRPQWPWRDWVVDALNANMPFDRFTVEQLAGDLLPDATLDQQLATAFNRNHMHNGEGGRIAEETRVENVFDRAETTATVWLGLTYQCARCHDHKFDPIGIDEYFALYDFFNQTSENGQVNQSDRAIPPSIAVPTAAQLARIAQLERQIAQMRALLAAPNVEADAAQLAWENDWNARAHERWRLLDPVTMTSTNGATLVRLPDGSIRATGERPEQDTYEFTARVDAADLIAVRLEALSDPQSEARSTGRAENGNAVLTEIEVFARPANDPAAAPQRVRFVSATADHAQRGLPPELAIDGKTGGGQGWATEGFNRKADNTATFIAAEPFGFPAGTELTVRLVCDSRHVRHTLARVRLSVTSDAALTPLRYDDWHVLGTLEPTDDVDAAALFAHDFGPESGVDLTRTYADGKLKWTKRSNLPDAKVHALPDTVGVTYLYRTVHAAGPRSVDLSLGSDDAIKLWVNGQQLVANNAARAATPDQEKATATLRAGANHVLLKIVNTGGIGGFYFRADAQPGDTTPPVVAAALDKPRAQRTDADRAAVADHFRRAIHPPTQPAYAALDQLIDQRDKARAAGDDLRVMVMDHLPKPRDTHVLVKGLYDKKTDRAVTANVPAVLPPLPEPDGASADHRYTRLDLARWIVRPDNPLTARVTVNRYWQTFFGKGLVATPDDFGIQGARPTHPALLDWLAVEFVETGWDVKRMHRLIVTSATYRQSSRVTPELLERDPENKLLARGPRYRWPSWMLRDQALAAAGLLVPTMGGEPVKPYQPPGIWAEATFNKKRYKQDDGDALYRRTLYTFWRRIVGPTVLFDSAKRQTCEVKPNLTNTPLHALVTLNETGYVEAARALAQRAMQDAGPSPEQRIAFAFDRLTARTPTADELSILTARYTNLREHYAANPDARAKLLAVGDSKRDDSLDPTDHAALTAVCNLLLNLDEVLTKQ